MKNCFGVLKCRSVVVFIVIFLLIPVIAHAKISKQIRAEFEKVYTPSLPQPGLVTAAEPLDMDDLRGFVVVEQNRVLPAERGFYVISPGKYDYRGAVIDGDTIKTRRGKIYTHVPRGIVMAIAGVVYSGRHIYVKLISMGKILSDRNPRLKPTKVTLMLGIKFDKKTLEANDIHKIISSFEKWIKPFPKYSNAYVYSESIGGPQNYRSETILD